MKITEKELKKLQQGYYWDRLKELKRKYPDSKKIENLKKGFIKGKIETMRRD